MIQNRNLRKVISLLVLISIYQICCILLLCFLILLIGMTVQQGIKGSNVFCLLGILKLLSFYSIIIVLDFLIADSHKHNRLGTGLGLIHNRIYTQAFVLLSCSHRQEIRTFNDHTGNGSHSEFCCSIL